MKNPHFWHFTTKDVTISDDWVHQFAIKYFEFMNASFDEEYLELQIKKQFSNSKEPYSSFGYTLIRSEKLNAEASIGWHAVDNSLGKQYISIIFDNKLSEDELKKYFDFFSELPNDLKGIVGMSDDYDVNKIRSVMLFPKYEVDQYGGPQTFLNYSDAYFVKELSNGSVIVWLRGPYTVDGIQYVYSDDYDDWDAFADYLKKNKQVDTK